MEGMRSLEEILENDKEKGEDPRSRCGRCKVVMEAEVGKGVWGAEVIEAT